MFKILLRDYTWTICTICGDHWAKKKNTGYNFQLYFKIIVLENDQLYARPVVKSPPEWCHRICLGSLKQFSEEPLVSLFAFSLSVLHSAFLTVSSFLCSIVCKIIFLTDIDEESLSGVDYKTNLFFSLNIHHGRVRLPLDTLTRNAG